VNKALIDSDMFSEILKAKNPAVARNATAYRQHHGTLSLSAITVMEGVYGFQRTQNIPRLQDFLVAVAKEEVIAFDQNSAELAGQIFGDLDRTGQRLASLIR
jgi:predicted nucleic acid-binding protein